MRGSISIGITLDCSAFNKTSRGDASSPFSFKPTSRSQMPEIWSDNLVTSGFEIRSQGLIFEIFHASFRQVHILVILILKSVMKYI